MEDNRKLAVSFGTFACVVEGYDDPFPIMRKTVRYFETLAEQNPDFARFADIVDYDTLVARLKTEDDAEIELEPIAGGVYIRKLSHPHTATPEIAAPDAAEDVAEPEADGQEHAEPEEDVSEADLQDLAALDGAPSDGLAMPMSPLPGDADDDAVSAGDTEQDKSEPALDEMPEDDASIPATARIADDEGQDLGLRVARVSPDSAETDEPGADEADEADTGSQDMPDTTYATGEDDNAPDAAPDSDEDQDETSPFQSTTGFVRPIHTRDEQERAEVDEDDVEAQAAAFTHSIDEDESKTDTSEPEPAAEDQTDEPAPLRLDQTATASDQDDDAPERQEQFGEQAEDAERAAPRPLFLRRDANADAEDADESKPDAGADSDAEQDDPAPHKPAASGPLRLGPELKPVATSEKTEHRPSFIDSVSPDDLPSTQSGEAAQSDEADTAEEPQKPERGGLRLGGLLRRKGGDTQTEDSAPKAEETAEAPEKPKGSILRVVESEPATDTAPQPEPGTKAESAEEATETEAAPETPARGGFRSFLRGKPKTPPAKEDAKPASPAETPDQADSAPEPAPEPQEAAPKPSMKPAARTASADGDEMKNRLHASYAAAPEPTGTKTFDLESEEDEDLPVTTPKGFAKAAGASALHEVMAAAAGFLSLVEHRATMSRNEIVDCAQQITGGAPLTAESKVKAFGKLTRTGDLVRIEGGLFMMSEDALHRYRQTLEGAA